MTTAASKRISHGLSLPQAVDSRDSVVNNILSSLATLDETTQLQWIQETSRQVDDERAYQRSLQSDRNNSMEQHRRYDHHDTLRDYNIESPAPVTGVGYRERGRTGSFTANLHTSSAPTPTVPMGRTSKPGFFRRFMGIGPKVPLEGDLVIASHSQKPNVLVKSPSASQVPAKVEKSIDALGSRSFQSIKTTSSPANPRRIPSKHYQKEILKLFPSTSKGFHLSPLWLITVFWRWHSEWFSSSES